MFYVTQGDLERSIYDLEQKLHFDFSGKTNRECIDIILENCSSFHKDSELQELGRELLNSIVEEYGYKALRVTYSVSHNIFGNDALSMKYSKLLDKVQAYYTQFLFDHNIKLKLDVYRFKIFLRDIYREEYGVLNIDYCMDCYSLINTIRLMDYDKDLIETLRYNLYWELKVSNLKYYLANYDYTSPNVLSEIYEYLAEELGLRDVYKGHNLFYDYDGYGNVVLDPIVEKH